MKSVNTVFQPVADQILENKATGELSRVTMAGQCVIHTEFVRPACSIRDGRTVMVIDNRGPVRRPMARVQRYFKPSDQF